MYSRELRELASRLKPIHCSVFLSADGESRQEQTTGIEVRSRDIHEIKDTILSPPSKVHLGASRAIYCIVICAAGTRTFTWLRQGFFTLMDPAVPPHLLATEKHKNMLTQKFLLVTTVKSHLYNPALTFYTLNFLYLTCNDNVSLAQSCPHFLHSIFFISLVIPTSHLYNPVITFYIPKFLYLTCNLNFSLVTLIINSHVQSYFH